MEPAGMILHNTKLNQIQGYILYIYFGECHMPNILIKTQNLVQYRKPINVLLNMKIFLQKTLNL